MGAIPPQAEAPMGRTWGLWLQMPRGGSVSLGTADGNPPKDHTCEAPEPSPPAVSTAWLPGGLSSLPALSPALRYSAEPTFPSLCSYGSSAPSPSLPEGCMVLSPVLPASPVVKNAAYLSAMVAGPAHPPTITPTHPSLTCIPGQDLGSPPAKEIKPTRTQRCEGNSVNPT